MPDDSSPNIIPEPLRGSDSGTFAHSSVVERLPEIAQRTIDENDFRPEIIRDVEELIDDIPQALIRPLADPLAPDADSWGGYVADHAGLNWLEIPWFFAEFYFYRRLLEATGYFQVGEQGYRADPFLEQKAQGLRLSIQLMEDLAAEVNAWSDVNSPQLEGIEALLVQSLWGNRADLSMWPADGGAQGGSENPKLAEKHILVNTVAQVADHLTSKVVRVDIVLDNAGFELTTDLFLVDFLLQSGVVQQIVLHPKAYPIFVSDVLSADLTKTLERLGDRSLPQANMIAARILRFLKNGQLSIHEHLFWTSPLALWEMPPALRAELARSDLVILKGDANYRRLLGDRHWPFAKPFEEIVGYFPAPIAALRTLKSEVACGLASSQIADLRAEDPDWMINGRWGLIQFLG